MAAATLFVLLPKAASLSSLAFTFRCKTPRLRNQALHAGSLATGAMMIATKNSPTKLVLAATFWVTAVAGGSWLMLNHEFSAGAAVPAAEHLPPEIGGLLKGSKPLTIVMAVHPDCPCTAASIEQLERLMARNTDSIRSVVMIRTRSGEPDDSYLRNLRLWKRLSAVPGLVVAADPGGSTAEKLGATVSGSVAAYDERGRLRFQGGLTPSRGHSGPSRGMDQLEAIARGNAPDLTGSAPAFGCGIENAERPRNS